MGRLPLLGSDGQNMDKGSSSKDEANTPTAPNLSGLRLLNPSLYSISYNYLVLTLYSSLRQTSPDIEE